MRVSLADQTQWGEHGQRWQKRHLPVRTLALQAHNNAEQSNQAVLRARRVIEKPRALQQPRRKWHRQKRPQRPPGKRPRPGPRRDPLHRHQLLPKQVPAQRLVGRRQHPNHHRPAVEGEVDDTTLKAVARGASTGNVACSFRAHLDITYNGDDWLEIEKLVERFKRQP